MAVGFTGLPDMLPVRGLRLGTTSAGIKKPGRRDLVVLALDEGAHCAGVFTRNAFCAAPVVVAKAHLAVGQPRLLLVNTGNANAGTGEQGLSDARESCAALARVAGCLQEQVLPFSTGVIGERLPLERIVAGMPAALATLREDGWEDAAWGIMTTDTLPKGASRQFELDGRVITVTGIAKGAGMIRPDMATMLAYVATDAAVAPAVLQGCLEQAANRSFNRVTIDGDTSTNDACVLIATGRAGNAPIETASGPDYAQLASVVTEVCEELAQKIVRDGEGATKFITVEVAGGANGQECLDVAYTIAHSPLVKTAFFASDPNWGRILAAVGRAGLNRLDLDAITIYLGDVCIVRHGGRAAGYTEGEGQRVMNDAEIVIRVELGRGDAIDRVWTCDFSYDYVKINAEYRT